LLLDRIDGERTIARRRRTTVTYPHSARRMTTSRFMLVLAAVPSLALAGIAPALRAQVVAPYTSSYLPGRYNWEFRRSYPAADRLFNGIDYSRARLHEILWTTSRLPVARLDTLEYARTVQEVLADPPRLPVRGAAVASGFSKLVPEVQAMLDWADMFHRQLYDVWADESIPLAEKDGRVVELLGYYRSRPGLALSSRPKSMDLPDGQLQSLAFRERFPRYNGLAWAEQWLRVGLYEALVTAQTPAQRKAQVDAAIARFWQMTRTGASENLPYLRPMSAAVAPAFARRYPEVGTVLDNLQLLQDAVADILTSREIPRSAKRQEILRAAALFRNDTAFAVSYDAGLRIVETMGANNMGGPAVGFTAELARPTVPRGMSLAGMDDTSADSSMAGMTGMPDRTGMPGMGATQDGMTMQQLLAIHQRMMADPVIRERAATDPVLQQMMQGMPHGDMPGMQQSGMSGMQGMQGMQHGNMPAGQGGMSMGNMGNMGAMGGTSAGTEPPMTPERRQAIDFMMRLLADPTVEAKIRANPELQALWADPEVQRRLAELRRAQTAKPSANETTTPATQAAPRTTPARPNQPQPAPQTPPAHQHKP
jgi:hypothetical protein